MFSLDKNLKKQELMKFINILLVSLLLILLGAPTSDAESLAINFKEIAIDPSVIGKDFINLRENYKYTDYFSSDTRDFYIKKNSGISISNDEIQSIIISDIASHPQEVVVQSVLFTFNKNSSKSLSTFSNRNINGLIAIMFNDVVFATAKVLEPVLNKMQVLVFGRSKEELKNELTYLTDNIEIK